MKPQPGTAGLSQGLFLTNNVTFIAINGFVGLSLAPMGWMATLPVMGYVVGGALSTGHGARSQSRWTCIRSSSGWWWRSCRHCCAPMLPSAGPLWLLCAATLVAATTTPMPACCTGLAAAEVAGRPRRRKPCRWHGWRTAGRDCRPNLAA
ncbi:MAG: hypothetical protein U1E71_05465 [Ramlibacter sp.]